VGKLIGEPFSGRGQVLISEASWESTDAIVTMSLDAVLVDTTHLDVC
jgi:hypothetical protein